MYADKSYIIGARSWVWGKLLKRAGMATKHELDAIWDEDPALLDDALRDLRDEGFIAYTNGYWYIREAVQAGDL